ncbi:MAG: DUF4198 domain-containing protein [Pseudomonadota bacterium]
MSIQFLDTTDHMVHGHEGWLETKSSHVHEGDSIELAFKWGHNMESHGLARKEGLTTFVVLPDGKRQDLRLNGQTEDSYLYDYIPETNGTYHFICQNTGHYVISREGKHLRGTLQDHPDAPTATFYRQFSHTCLQAGEDQANNPIAAMPELPFSLVPEIWKHWQTGDVLVFSLQKENNKLPDVQIDMAHTNGPGNQVFQKNFKTDKDGNLRIKIEEPGRYLLIARHRTPEGKPGLYYDTSLTYTFLFCIEK